MNFNPQKKSPETDPRLLELGVVQLPCNVRSCCAVTSLPLDHPHSHWPFDMDASCLVRICKLVQAVQVENADKISIHDLSQRVYPFGFHARMDGKKDDYYDRLHIGNMFRRTLSSQSYCGRWAPSNPQFDPAHISLDPCPLPPEIQQPAEDRLQAVTMVYCDGSKAPETVGIKVGCNATYEQLSKGIKEQRHVPDDQQVTLVLLNRHMYIQ